jgi:peptidoglycan/LPS O-acetylase OafA/YrhL
VPPAVLVLAAGSTWTIDHLFWVDLALGPAIACALVAVATGQAGLFGRLFDSRPLRRLGATSYSLYLTHGPIVIALYYGVLEGRVDQGVPMFLVLTAVAIPLTIGFARIFGAAFEIPFQRRRSWAALRAARSGTPLPRRSAANQTVRPARIRQASVMSSASRPAPTADRRSITSGTSR